MIQSATLLAAKLAGEPQPIRVRNTFIRRHAASAMTRLNELTGGARAGGGRRTLHAISSPRRSLCDPVVATNLRGAAMVASLVAETHDSQAVRS